MSTVTLLGIPIDAISKNEALQRIAGFLGENQKRHVVTPNNEMLVTAHSDSAFRAVLQKADLHLADSTGLLLAAKMTGQNLPERVTGVDTVEKLLRGLGSEHPVFLLGGRNGVGDRVRDRFEKENPNLVVAGVHEGSANAVEAPEIIKKINDSGAQLLLVAFGAPAQDMWIAQNLLNLPSVRVAMGVGGTFDFLSGAISRAPKWMRCVGIEWVWRLLLQPSRIGRIFNAVVVFPLLVVRYGKRATP